MIVTEILIIVNPITQFSLVFGVTLNYFDNNNIIFIVFNSFWYTSLLLK